MNLKEFIEQSTEDIKEETFEGLGKIIYSLPITLGYLFDSCDGKSTTSNFMTQIAQVFKELKSESQSFSVELSKVQESAYESFIDTKEYLIKDKMTQQRLILIKVHNLCTDILNIYSNIEINGCKKEDNYFNEISNKNYHIFITLLIFLKNISIDINDVMDFNLKKLKERKDKGKLGGSGEEIENRV